MTLTDLQFYVDRMMLHADSNHKNPDDIHVGIVTTQYGSIGGTPLTEIQSIEMGFDWDNGKCLIRPQNKLVVIDDSDLVEWGKSHNAARWDYFQQKLKDNNGSD